MALTVAFVACKRPEQKTRGVGDALKAFIMKNCETGQQYCQVCAYSGKPLVMAVADHTDQTFEQDLVRLQKLVDRHADKGLKAFAIIGRLEDGKLTTPDREEEISAKLKEARARLGLTIPVGVLPRKGTSSEQRGFADFADSYEIAASRMVLFATAENRIVFADTIRSDRADEQFRALEAAIAKAL
jgi:hypothetical protein